LKLETPLDMVKYSLLVHFFQLGRREPKTITRFG